MKGRIVNLQKFTNAYCDDSGTEQWGSREYCVSAFVKVYELDYTVEIPIRDELLDYYDTDKIYGWVFNNAYNSLVGEKVDVFEDDGGDYYIDDLEDYLE